MRHQVDRHDALDLVDLRFVEVAHDGDTDVVDPSTERRQFLRPLARRGEHAAIGGIASNDVVSGAELPPHLRRPVCVDLNADGMPAVLCEPVDDRPADAGPHTGDDDARLFHLGAPLLWFLRQVEIAGPKAGATGELARLLRFQRLSYHTIDFAERLTFRGMPHSLLHAIGLRPRAWEMCVALTNENEIWEGS
jgi:hypothetical protein